MFLPASSGEEDGVEFSAR